ncbi:Mannosyl-oligosaccharide alpha-1,2-mannosidase isoform B, variant 2 [Balamuthia mandrillaris]
MLPTYQQRNRRKKGGFRDASVFNCSTNTLLMWVVGFFIFTTLAPMLFLMEWGGGGGGGSGGDGGSPITGPPGGPPFEPQQQTDSKFDAETQRRQASVREGFLHAWNSYKQYAWGWDELQPLTMKGKNWFGRSGMGATILDAMDTMWLMGYTHEFDEAKQFISQLDFGKIEGTVSTFETTIRALGGLLSCYALDGDPMFLEKAEDLGVRLLKAFPAGSKMPKASVSLTTGTGSYPSWTGGNAILSEVGTIQLEFMYLAKLTRNAEFARQVSEVVDVLDDQEKPGNLYTIYLEPKTGKMKHGTCSLNTFLLYIVNSCTLVFVVCLNVIESRVTMGALGDSWYEYLLKMWLLTNEQVPKFRRMYNEAVQGIMDYMVATSVPNQLTYIAELNSAVKKQKITKMDHLVCFAGGMFALGAYKNVDPVNREKHLELGKELTRTCHESYKRMPTGIGPEVIEFNPLRVGGKDLGSQVHDYLLRPGFVSFLPSLLSLSLGVLPFPSSLLSRSSFQLFSFSIIIIFFQNRNRGELLYIVADNARSDLQGMGMGSMASH